MTIRETIFKCGVAGAVVLFIIGWLTWAATPMFSSQFNKFQDESRVQETILNNAPKSGLYTLPSCCHKEKKVDKGPFIFMSIMKEETSYNMAGSVIKAFLMKFIGACIVTGLLLQTKLNFRQSVWFIAVIGFLISFMGKMPDVIWFQFPGKFAFFCILEGVIGWFFAGLAIAKLAKR